MSVDHSQKEFFVRREIIENPTLRRVFEIVMKNAASGMQKLMEMRDTTMTVEKFRAAVRWLVDENLFVRSVESHHGRTTHNVKLFVTEFGKKIHALLPPVTLKTNTDVSTNIADIERLIRKNPSYERVLRFISLYEEGKRFRDLDPRFRSVQSILTQLRMKGALSKNGHNAPYIITAAGKKFLASRKLVTPPPASASPPDPSR